MQGLNLWPKTLAAVTMTVTSSGLLTRFCKRGEKSNKLWISSTWFYAVKLTLPPPFQTRKGLARLVTVGLIQPFSFRNISPDWTDFLSSAQNKCSCLLLNHKIPFSFLKNARLPPVCELSSFQAGTNYHLFTASCQVYSEPNQQQTLSDCSPQPQTVVTGEILHLGWLLQLLS